MASQPESFLIVPCLSIGWSVHFPSRSLCDQPCVPVGENIDDKVSFSYSDSGHWRASRKGRERCYGKKVLWGNLGIDGLFTHFFQDQSVHVLADGSAIFLC